MSDDVGSIDERLERATRLMHSYSEFMDENADAHAVGAQALLDAIDPKEYVGRRHHVVPRFVLERWANSAKQVQVYRRVEGQFHTGKIDDLAIKDFYTFVDLDGEKNSSMESVLGVVEVGASEAIGRLLSPRRLNGSDEAGVLVALAQFAAFQMVRTPRGRRGIELMADVYLKTLARGRISDAELRRLEAVPHQNDSIGALLVRAPDLVPLFGARPVALITLSEPCLLIGDDPIVFDTPDEDHHHPDCFLTDEEIEARHRRRRRKDRRKPDSQKVSRVIHLRTTTSHAAGAASQMAMPISPKHLLVWGPLTDGPFYGPIRRIRLDDEATRDLAQEINHAMCERALDWVVSTVGDSSFRDREFPAMKPLLEVCDGGSAASAAANSVPKRIRPRRLWVPEQE